MKTNFGLELDQSDGHIRSSLIRAHILTEGEVSAPLVMRQDFTVEDSKRAFPAYLNDGKFEVVERRLGEDQRHLEFRLVARESFGLGDYIGQRPVKLKVTGSVLIDAVEQAMAAVTMNPAAGLPAGGGKGRTVSGEVQVLLTPSIRLRCKPDLKEILLAGGKDNSVTIEAALECFDPQRRQWVVAPWGTQSVEKPEPGLPYLLRRLDVSKEFEDNVDVKVTKESSVEYQAVLRLKKRIADREGDLTLGEFYISCGEVPGQTKVAQNPLPPDIHGPKEKTIQLRTRASAVDARLHFSRPGWGKHEIDLSRHLTALQLQEWKARGGELEFSVRGSLRIASFTRGGVFERESLLSQVSGKLIVDGEEMEIKRHIGGQTGIVELKAHDPVEGNKPADPPPLDFAIELQSGIVAMFRELASAADAVGKTAIDAAARQWIGSAFDWLAHGDMDTVKRRLLDFTNRIMAITSFLRHSRLNRELFSRVQCLRLATHDRLMENLASFAIEAISFGWDVYQATTKGLVKEEVALLAEKEALKAPRESFSQASKRLAKVAEETGEALNRKLDEVGKLTAEVEEIMDGLLDPKGACWVGKSKGNWRLNDSGKRALARLQELAGPSGEIDRLYHGADGIYWLEARAVMASESGEFFQSCAAKESLKGMEDAIGGWSLSSFGKSSSPAVNELLSRKLDASGKLRNAMQRVVLDPTSPIAGSPEKYRDLAALIPEAMRTHNRAMVKEIEKRTLEGIAPDLRNRAGEELVKEIGEKEAGASRSIITGDYDNNVLWKVDAARKQILSAPQYAQHTSDLPDTPYPLGKGGIGGAAFQGLPDRTPWGMYPDERTEAAWMKAASLRVRRELNGVEIIAWFIQEMVAIPSRILRFVVKPLRSLAGYASERILENAESWSWLPSGKAGLGLEAAAGQGLSSEFWDRAFSLEKEQLELLDAFATADESKIPRVNRKNYRDATSNLTASVKSRSKGTSESVMEAYDEFITGVSLKALEPEDYNTAAWRRIESEDIGESLELQSTIRRGYDAYAAATFPTGTQPLSEWEKTVPKSRSSFGLNFPTLDNLLDYASLILSNVARLFTVIAAHFLWPGWALGTVVLLGASVADAAFATARVFLGCVYIAPSVNGLLTDTVACEALLFRKWIEGKYDPET